MSDFTFQDGDAKALDDLCLRARKRAKNHPCYTLNMAVDPKYSFRFGPFNLSFTLDALEKPFKWHASAACLQEIGTQPVQLPSGIIAQQPLEAIVYVAGWSDEEKKRADFLLGELMKPFITDEQQQVVVTDALFARHMTTEAKL